MNNNNNKNKQQPFITCEREDKQLERNVFIAKETGLTQHGADQ